MNVFLWYSPCECEEPYWAMADASWWLFMFFWLPHADLMPLYHDFNVLSTSIFIILKRHQGSTKGAALTNVREKTLSLPEAVLLVAVFFKRGDATLRHASGVCSDKFSPGGSACRSDYWFCIDFFSLFCWSVIDTKCKISNDMILQKPCFWTLSF